MLRTILVGLDGTAESLSAMHLGIEWARRADAMLVGLAIVDQPAIASTVPLIQGRPPHADPLVYDERMSEARQQAERCLEQFALGCAEAGVASKVLEENGLPADRIVLEAQRYDLILLGQRTHFYSETPEWHEDTLWKVLKCSPRPVVAVPGTWAAGRSVVVAYDGSLQAARALSAFEASGLHRSREVHVVSVRGDRKEAACIAERAVDFLWSHEIRATAHPLASSGAAAEIIRGRVQELGAELLVMGAFGQPTLKEFFLGSATRTLLKESPVPVFLFH